MIEERKGQVIAFVFARGGSRGVPNKNLRLLAGKPLLAHAIESARASRYVERVVVSTDSPTIARVATHWGAEVPFQRPSDLATDDASEFDAWQHAVRHVYETSSSGFEVFVSVPTTAPLRVAGDIDAVVDRLRDGPFDIVMTLTEAHRNPWIHMAQVDAEGAVSLLQTNRRNVTCRQNAPPVYDRTAVAYAAWPHFVLRSRDLWDGRVGAVLVPAERSLDIDTEEDLLFAEFALGRRGLSGSAAA
jgi:N-acylneuraminate cytidylyltransferase